MANNINWGKVYCEMETNDSWGQDTYWSTNSVPDISAPDCWLGFIIRASSTLFTSDTTTLTADKTQL